MDINNTFYNNARSVSSTGNHISAATTTPEVAPVQSTSKQSNSNLQGQFSKASTPKVIKPVNTDSSVEAVSVTTVSVASKKAVELNAELPPNEEKLESKKLFSTQGTEDKNSMQQVSEAQEKAAAEKKEEESKTSKLDKIIGAIEHFVSKTDRRLSFEVAEDSTDYIIKVYEARTGRVLRSIPAAELLDVANSNADTSSGSLFSQKI